MKRGIFFIFCIYIILSIFLISGVSVGDNIPVQIQTTDDSGNIITGTFNFTINISNSSTCSPVLYSNTTTKTTDARGIVSYNLENVSLDFNEQYWFCYYRDSVLKQTTKIARTPYAFRAKNVTLSGIEVDSNFNLSSYNFTTLGGVGIGTTTPSSGLHISSPSYQDHILIDREGNGSYITQSAFSTLIEAYGSTNALDIFGGVMEIGTDGKVGIGTTNPSQKLDVLGAIQLSDNTGSNEAGVIRWTGSDFQGYNGSAWNTFATSGGGSLWGQSGSDIYYNNGNVGIGTASPSEKLHIMDNVDTKLRIESTLTGTQGATALTLYNNVSDTPYYWNIQALGTDGRFRIYDVAGVSQGERFTIDQSGNVGIGTTSPTEELHVNDTGGASYVQGIFEGSNGSGGIQLINDINQIWEMQSVSNASAGLESDFIIYDRTGTAYMLVIQNGTGNVGIGTASPRAKFDIMGGSFSDPKYSQGHVFDFASATGVNANRYFNYTSQNTAAYAGLLTIQGHVTDGGAVDVNSIISLQPTAGNVGIGTITPAAKLSVLGNTTVTDSTKYNMQLYDTNALALGGGGGLLFGGVYESDGSMTRGGAIDLYKETATTGEYGFALRFHTRENNQALTQKMHIAGDGKVGIGTTSPEQDLHVKDTTANVVQILETDKVDGVARLELRNDVQQWDIRIRGDSIDEFSLLDGTNSKFPFIVEPDTPSNTLYLQATTGNVGIGTASPNSPLEIYTLNDNNAVTFHTTATGTGDGIRMFWKSDNLTAGYNHDLLVQIAGTNVGQLAWALDGTNGSYFKIATKVDGGSLSEKFRITNAGNVGIGTTSPISKLHIEGDLGVTAAEHTIFRWRRTGGTDGLYSGYGADGADVDDIFIRTGGALPLKFGTSTTPEALTILDDGKVGIKSLEGTYSNGEAYVCVYNNGTIFAKDSACS